MQRMPSLTLAAAVLLADATASGDSLEALDDGVVPAVQKLVSELR